MSLKKPVKWKEIDFNKIHIGLDKKIAKLFYETEQGLQELNIQFPHMHLPFGIKENENKNQWSNFKEYYLDSCIKDFSEKEKFNNFLNTLNEVIIKQINDFNNFKEPCTSANYYNVQKSNEIIKLNIMRNKEGDFNSYLFKYNPNKKHEKVLLKEENIHDIIKKGIVFIPTVNCSKIYYYKENYGSVWNIIQMLIIEKQKTTNSVYTSYGF